MTAMTTCRSVAQGNRGKGFDLPVDAKKKGRLTTLAEGHGLNSYQALLPSVSHVLIPFTNGALTGLGTAVLML